MSRLSPVALLLGASLILIGCGQKGPLYLPDDEAAAERYGDRAAPQQEPLDNATDEDAE